MMNTNAFVLAVALAAAAVPGVACAQAITPIPQDAVATLNGEWLGQHAKIHIRIRDGVVTVVSNDSVTTPSATSAWVPGSTWGTLTGIASHEGNRVNYQGSYNYKSPATSLMTQNCDRFHCYAFKATFGQPDVIGLNLGGLTFWRREVFTPSLLEARR